VSDEPWVRTPDDVARLAATLSSTRALALDSESDSLHHHREKVCLIQLADDAGRTFLVDPLAVRDLSALAPVIADPQVRKVLHGADYDVTTLKRDFGFAFAGIFDTMIAARFIGLPAVGLQAVAQTELGIALSKDSQKDDWSRRPLTPTQEHYAREDVRHLLVLQARLQAKLQEQGRLAWVLEECDAVATLEPARRRHDDDTWQKMKGVRQLPARAREIARRIHAWRETVADATDVPAFKILNTDTIFAMAKAPPRAETDLRAYRGIYPRFREHAPALVETIAQALASSERSWAPLSSSPKPPPVPPATKARIDALRAWRTLEGARLALDISIVLPQRLLERVAEAAPRTLEDLALVDGLRRWRVEALGASMLAALPRTLPFDGGR
jgi:ribonuclease D